MTHAVGGKINKNGMKRRKRGGGGIIKNRKEVFPCFLQLFSHGKAPVILRCLLQ